ncbi:hypothetical protein AU476_16460 [Cupriavidus sp. UYMSc13B]|nr:hypothetical protein AU476_16460 [Cupriavidus sp. UYMSc13B]
MLQLAPAERADFRHLRTDSPLKNERLILIPQALKVLSRMRDRSFSNSCPQALQHPWHFDKSMQRLHKLPLGVRSNLDTVHAVYHSLTKCPNVRYNRDEAEIPCLRQSQAVCLRPDRKMERNVTVTDHSRNGARTVAAMNVHKRVCILVASHPYFPSTRPKI